MLVRDPAKRSTLEFLSDDTWINEGYPDSPVERDLSSAPVEEDEEIIAAILRKLPPMERETLLQSLRQNMYDDISAIYYLMYYEKQAKGADFRLSPDTATGPQLLPAADAGADLPPLPTSDARGDKEMSIGSDQVKQGKAKNKPTSPSPSFASLPEPAPQQPVQHAATAPAAPTRPANPMARIDEDTVLHDEPEHEEEQGASSATDAAPETAKQPIPVRPNVVAIPVDSRNARRRRFTVGGEAEVQKLADDEDRIRGAANGPAEAAELLRRLQTLQREQQMQALAQGTEDDRRGLRGRGDAPTHPVSMIKVPQRSSTSGPPDAGPGNLDAQSAAQPISPTETDKSSKPRSAISGFFRTHLRRQSDNPGGASASAATDSTYYTAAMIADVNAMSISTTGSAAGPTASYSSVDPNDDKPRSLRFTFNSSTTSSKHPDEIVREVIYGCDRTGMTYRPLGKYLVEVTAMAAEPDTESEGGAVGADAVKFEVEVCKLPRLKNLVGFGDFVQVCGFEKLSHTFHFFSSMGSASSVCKARPDSTRRTLKS
jgi:MAP/microtubule affinity-regulating kinase